MTTDQLCALALAAIDSEDARVVLADAIEESGWRSAGAERLLGNPIWVEKDRIQLRLTPALMADFSFGCLAIAAVLLFGEWDEEMWPTVERCEWVYYQVADRAGWFGPVHRRDLEGRNDVTLGPTPSRDLRRLDLDEDEAGEQSSFEALGY